MTNSRFFWMILLMAVSVSLAAQENTSKEQRKLEMQKQTEELVKTTTFVFAARTAYPQGGRSVNLSMDNYSVEYNPELIVCELPFYGEAYGGVAYGGGGIRFTAKPGPYSVENTKKGYIIKTEVKEASDTYILTLTVGTEGSGSLAIYSNNRSSITFAGDVLPKNK